jgi:hypothetical protein
MNNSGFDKEVNTMFKVFAVIFTLAVCAVLAGWAFWGTVAYFVVTKGPEAVQRVERVMDAQAEKMELENENAKKKSE